MDADMNVTAVYGTSYFFFYFLFFFVTIVALNALIALMGSSYEKVVEKKLSQRSSVLLCNDLQLGMKLWYIRVISLIVTLFSIFCREVRTCVC